MQQRRPIPPFLAGASLIACLIMVVWLGIIGYQTHQAVCTLRGDLVERAKSSERYLKLTDAERVREFGRLGRIPRSTILVQLHQQHRTIDALGSAHCDSTWGVFFS